MSTLNEEILRLKNAKAAIDEVLIARGVSIPKNATLDTYNELINSIQGGTSSEEVTATKANVLAGTTTITADSNDEIVEGTMPNNSGQAKGTDNVYFDDSYMQVTVKYPGYYDETSTIRIGKSNLGDATADKVLEGTTYSSSEGLNMSGNIPIKSADTYFASTNDLTIDAGQYLGGTQTIKGLAQTNFSPANIKTGVTVKINNGDRDLFSATGTYTNDADATSADMLNGKTAYVKGEKVTGTIPTRTSWTYDPSQTDEYGATQISADNTNSRMYVRFPGDTYYAYSLVDGKKRNPFVYIPYSSLSSVLGIEASKMLTTETIAGVTGTIPVQGAVTPAALGAGGSYTIPAGYHNGSGKVTVQSLATMTASGDATAAQILSGKKAYVDGNLITGTIASKAAATYYATTSDQTIAAGQYLSGAQTIKKLTSSNFSAANIKTGVTVSVNNGNANVFSVAGTFCSDATLASAANLLSGQIAYGKSGTKYTGTMATLAGGTYTPSTSAQTISCSGKKMTSNIVISAIPSKYVDFSAGVTFFEYGASESAMFTALGTCNQKPQAGIPVSEWKTTWQYKYDKISWGNYGGPTLLYDLDENDQVDHFIGFCTKKSMDFTGIKTVNLYFTSFATSGSCRLFFYNINTYTLTYKTISFTNGSKQSIDISSITGQCLWGMDSYDTNGRATLNYIKFSA